MVTANIDNESIRIALADQPSSAIIPKENPELYSVYTDGADATKHPVAVGPNNGLAFAEQTTDGTLYYYDDEGNEQWRDTRINYELGAVAFGKESGDIWSAQFHIDDDDLYVYKYDRTDGSETEIAVFDFFNASRSDIAVDEENENVWVYSDDGDIGYTNLDGSTTDSTTADEAVEFYSLEVLNSDEAVLAVSDTDGDIERVYVYDTDLIDSYEEVDWEIYGLTVDDDQNIFVSAENDFIIFNENLDKIKQIDMEDSEPQGLEYISDGRIVTGDKDPSRIYDTNMNQIGSFFGGGVSRANETGVIPMIDDDDNTRVIDLSKSADSNTYKVNIVVGQRTDVEINGAMVKEDTGTEDSNSHTFGPVLLEDGDTVYAYGYKDNSGKVHGAYLSGFQVD